MELLGLDIGTNYIKAVSVERGKNRRLRRLKKYAYIPSEGSADRILSESKKDLTDAAAYLKTFLLENSFVANQAVAVIPDKKVFTKVISLPYLEGDELISAIEWEADQYIPHSLSEVYLRHSIISQPSGKPQSKKLFSGLIKSKESEEEKEKEPAQVMEVMLIAARKNVVNKYLWLLNKAGLEPVGLEPASIATVRSTTKNDLSIPTIIVDFGYSKVSFYLAVDNRLRFVRTIDFSISNMIRVIKQELDMSEKQSSEYLLTYGLKENELNGKIREVVLPVAKIIADELKKSQHFIENRPKLIGKHETNKIRRAIVSGGGALIPDIMIYLAKELELEIEYAKPWESIGVSGVGESKKLDEIGPLFSASVGAVMKDF